MQLHNQEQKVNTKQLFKIKYLKPYFRNIVNTLNFSNATHRNEHAFQLLFVPLQSIIIQCYPPRNNWGLEDTSIWNL